MAKFRLTPKSEFLSKEYLLVQAWKKAHDYIRRSNWYADVLELDLTNADLANRLSSIAAQLKADEELKPDLLRLILAPKSQQWVIEEKQWLPTKGNKGAEQRLRPLAHLSVRDQIIATSFMILMADLVESRQGDPRVTIKKAREQRMVSYGHRLFCDGSGLDLRYRWGNAVVYRQFFLDYQTFVARPQQVVQDVFGEEKNWAIVTADLSQFYDRVRPEALATKVESLLGDAPDHGFMARFRSFFCWKWHPRDSKDAQTYAKNANPVIEGFDEIALPQGLVASGFFSNVYLLDFDDSVSQGFENWHDNDGWKLVDFCRYVDDMRIVVGLGDDLKDADEATIAAKVSQYLIQLLGRSAEGMYLKPEKTSVILGRNAAAGSIRVSETMKRINHNTSGAVDLLLGEETIDMIEGLFFAHQEDPLNFEDKFHDTFFAAKPDVGDDTVARFAANRFRKTYRSLRPMCEESSSTSDESLLPSLSQEILDNKAAVFSRRLIERWVRDPSNMRLLRVALDVYPDPKALDVVLDLLKQYVDIGTKRKVPRRVAWYCAAELLKAGATETGLVSDEDLLPADIDLKEYQEKLTAFAEQIVQRRNTYPWYLEQQAHLYLACMGKHIDRKSSDPYLSNYLRLHDALAGRAKRLRREDVVPFILLQYHFQGTTQSAINFLLCFREVGTPTQRKLLLRIIQENSKLAVEINRQMTPEEVEAWAHLYRVYGIQVDGRFPETEKSLPDTKTTYGLLDVAKSKINPFRQEYLALKFALAFLERIKDDLGILFPTRIKITAEDWRALYYNQFPLADDAFSLEFDSANEIDERYSLPEWVEASNAWKYKLGQILRVLLTGTPDFTMSVKPTRHDRSISLYSQYSSSWLRRRYGLFNGRNAFGPPWIPISSWLGALLSRLMEWPGCAHFDSDFELPDEFDIERLTTIISHRIKELERLYGRSFYTPVLPIRTKKLFMRQSYSGSIDDEESLYKMRVGVVQTVIPRKADFTDDIELIRPETRRRHRRHLSAVLGGVHRMLQVRESHREDRPGIELLVFPELSIHPNDLRSHIVPFVKQHQCIVFAGMVFHPPAEGYNLVNSAYWIIPSRTPLGGVQIDFVEQGKGNPTDEELGLGIIPFRPAQWVLEMVHPRSHKPLWAMSGSICYDSTDLSLAADLRDITDMFVISALNKDVGTFDNMAAALHYHMFQHVILANCGEYGGSTGQAPFDDRNSRTIFHSHGNEQVSINFFEVNLMTYRTQPPKLKTPPAGYDRH